MLKLRSLITFGPIRSLSTLQISRPMLSLLSLQPPIPDLNLNAGPAANPPVIYLNAPMDMEEMIIDPVFGNPQPNEMYLELNDFLEQINEAEEDEENVEENLLEANVVNFAHDPLDMEVNIPILNGPADNFLPLEIQEDDLMNDEEIQEMIEEEAAQPADPLVHNLQVGFVFTNVTIPAFGPHVTKPSKASLLCLAHGLDLLNRMQVLENLSSLLVGLSSLLLYCSPQVTLPVLKICCQAAPFFHVSMMGVVWSFPCPGNAPLRKLLFSPF